MREVYKYFFFFLFYTCYNYYIIKGREVMNFIINKSVYLVILSIIYIFTLSVIYFSKRRMNNYENKIYKTMLVSCFIGLLLQWIFTFLAFNSHIYPTIIINTISKASLVQFVFFMVSMLKYMLVISNPKKEVFIINLSTIFLAILSVIICSLNISYSVNFTESIAYSYGTSVIFTYIIAIFITFLLLTTLIFKRKNISKRKTAPLYLFIMLAFIISFVQIRYPELNLMIIAEAFLCFLMYFTIENPDMAMLDEVDAARKEAIKANKAKTNFLASISKDIRNPLTAIVGLSEDVKANSNQLSPAINDDLTDIIAASNRVLEIVGNVLDITNIEQSRMDIENVSYNFNKEVMEVVRIWQSKVPSEVELRVNFANNIPYELIGDKVHIKQVIDNLLSNAIKNTTKGFVGLEVKCENVNNTSHLMIIVSDSGKGIETDKIATLFNSYDNMDDEDVLSENSSGVGLSVTKRLIDMMNGSIDVKSEVGKGSMFIIQLPQLIQTMSKPVDPTLNENNYVNNFGFRKILIVDDNKVNIKVAERALARYGFEIESVLSGTECLEKVKTKKYDLIFLDIMMPGMNGEQTLVELSKIDNFDTPVVALTADAVEGAREKYLAEGFDGYLAKPFSREQIDEKLREVLK